MILLPAHPCQTLHVVTWQTPAQDEDADLLAPPGVLTRARPTARETADRGLRRSPLPGAAGLGADHTPQLMPETLDAVMGPDVDVLHNSGDLGMQASLSSLSNLLRKQNICLQSTDFSFCLPGHCCRNV